MEATDQLMQVDFTDGKCHSIFADPLCTATTHALADDSTSSVSLTRNSDNMKKVKQGKVSSTK